MQDMRQVISELPTGPYARIAVVGAGAWGTALAIVAARAGRSVSLWGRNAEHMVEMSETRENRHHLAGCTLPAGVEPVSDLAEALDGAEAVLLVTPSKTIREIARSIAPFIAPGVPVALCAKGIEVRTGLLMSEVVAEELPDQPIGALSGPTFADETAKGYPTAATVAFPFGYRDRLAPRSSPAARLALSMGSESFRPYISDDVVGVEIGGAVKNVIAIACGMMTGAGFAANTRAALITRGMDEIKALAEALGGRRETVTGLAGAGDLTLTCSSMSSRNMTLGVQLGEGRRREDCFDGHPVVVEGEVSAISVTDLARRAGVQMPICETVRRILHEGAAIGESFAALWASPIEAEPRGLDIALDHPVGNQSAPSFERVNS